MKATIIRTLGKVFVKSDYNGNFVADLKREIPVKSRRWNSAFSMGLFYRLMSGVPREALENKNFFEEVKEICDSGMLKKTWEVDKKYYDKVKNLCLKYFFEVYEKEEGNSSRVLASETMDYEEINRCQDRLLNKAEKYRPGKVVTFQWDFEAESSPDTKRDNINFQFYCSQSEKWFFATYFSQGPKEEIGPEISSVKQFFDVEYTKDGYSYKWRGKFFSPVNTLFKFNGSFYLVIDENRVGVLGEDLEGWSRANQIIEYQKILLRLDEINSDREKMEFLFRSKPLQILDMEYPAQPVVPVNSLEIIE